MAVSTNATVKATITSFRLNGEHFGSNQGGNVKVSNFLLKVLTLDLSADSRDLIFNKYLQDLHP